MQFALLVLFAAVSATSLHRRTDTITQAPNQPTLLCSESDSGPVCPEGYICDSEIVSDNSKCQIAIPLGQDCQVQHDLCAKNSYCRQSDTKRNVGTCTSLPKPGEKCTTEAKFPCILGYTCLLDDTVGVATRTCVRSPRQLGELCTFATKCVHDSYCQYSMSGKATGRCTAFSKLRQPCDGGFATGRLCASGLGCYAEEHGKPGVCMVNESGSGSKCSPFAGLICDSGRAYCKLIQGKHHGICTTNAREGELCGKIAGSKVKCAHSFGCLKKKDGFTGVCTKNSDNAVGAPCQAFEVECVDSAYCPVTLMGGAVCTLKVGKGERCGGDRSIACQHDLECVDDGNASVCKDQSVSASLLSTSGSVKQ